MNKTCGTCHWWGEDRLVDLSEFYDCVAVHRMPAVSMYQVMSTRASCDASACPSWKPKKDKADG
jgi:hypothetical protein